MSWSGDARTLLNGPGPQAPATCVAEAETGKHALPVPFSRVNGVQAEMISAAHVRVIPSITAGVLPEQLQRLRLETDWLAFLPARADSTSWRIQQQIKRVLDVVLAAVLLLLLSPLLLLTMLLVRFTSPGPVLYRYWALGHCARPFQCYKFRTMVDGADAMKDALLPHNEMRGPAFKLRQDPRVTRLGRFLRKYSIDELPQLWNVLRGDMSLVGPRPPLAEEFAQFLPWQRGKLAVRPGITCLWQVSGRSEIQDFSRWAALDLEYIERWNLWLDGRILLRTIPAVLLARGAY